MLSWTADYVNDPDSDYDVITEILFEDQEVAVIKKGLQGLELKWWPTDKELHIPLDWLVKLLVEAQDRL